MKKSEMIDIIEEILFHKIMDWDVENYKPNAGDTLLRGIEEAGMLPPNIMPDSLQLTERNAEFLAKVNRHFKWESEDEA